MKPPTFHPAKTDHEPPRMEFAPVKPRRVFEEIILQIRRELTLGNLRPGDKLPAERDLAKQFGTSRTAVREALRTLENAGIILSRKGVKGGVFVREADPGLLTRLLGDMVDLGSISLASLTEARVHILGIVVELACLHGSEAQFAGMEEAVDVAEQHTLRMSAQRRQEAIGSFYEQLGLATGNEVLVMLVRSITEIMRGTLLDVAPAPRLATIPTFRAIIAALRGRDAGRAAQLMREHLVDLHQHLLEARAQAPAAPRRAAGGG